MLFVLTASKVEKAGRLLGLRNHPVGLAGVMILPELDLVDKWTQKLEGKHVFQMIGEPS